MIVNPPRLDPKDCRSEPLFEPVTYEKVVGINNLYSIAWLRQGLEMARTVARVVKANGERATGFLIEGNRLVTNNHVLPDAAEARVARAEFNVEKDWHGMDLATTGFAFDTDRFFVTDPGLDYTIVGVAEEAAAEFGCIDTSLAANPTVNDYVAVIQQPDGGPKQISLTDNKVQAVFGDLVQYSADTANGSSGAPVFNENWQLVALHSRGGALAGAPGAQHWVNEGVHFGAVLRHLASGTSATVGEAPLGAAGASRPTEVPYPMDLYFHVFAGLRPHVASLLSPARPLRKEDWLLDGIGRYEQLRAPFDVWIQALNAEGLPVLDSAIREGCACGVAFDAVVRPTGHESLNVPYASRGLPRAENRAADVYLAAHERLRSDRDVPGIVGELAKGIDEDESGVVRGFIRGLVQGGDRGSRWGPWHPDDEIWPKRPR